MAVILSYCHLSLMPPPPHTHCRYSLYYRHLCLVTFALFSLCIMNIPLVYYKALWYPALIFGIPYGSHCFCIISPFCIFSYSIHKDTISGIYRFTVALYYVYAQPLGGMNDHLGYILHVTQEEARFYQFVAQPISYILENINIIPMQDILENMNTTQDALSSTGYNVYCNC